MLLLGWASGDDATVEAALADEVGAVFADESQLGQVIVNLAANARDAVPGGGTLTVSTADATLDEHPGLDFVRLAFADTGTGIPLEIVGNVFDPFFTTKPHVDGAGPPGVDELRSHGRSSAGPRVAPPSS